jgi:hypothetical protein
MVDKSTPVFIGADNKSKKGLQSHNKEEFMTIFSLKRYQLFSITHLQPQPCHD